MLYDISPPVSAASAVWPGDVPFAVEGRGPSAFRTTAHVGAHVDAPSHVQGDGCSIDGVALEPFIGPCQVIHVEVPPGSMIEPQHIREPLLVPRILLATGRVPADGAFDRGFAAPSPALAEALVAAGIELLGVDTPSVDCFGAEGLPVHERLVAGGIAILEGLVLADVPGEVYELIALPLRLVGCDGSPVRAVLRSLEFEARTCPCGTR
jgi:arylformamidase